MYRNVQAVGLLIIVQQIGVLFAVSGFLFKYYICMNVT